jgi:hypothetical protein
VLVALPTFTSDRVFGAISLPRKRCGLLVPLALGHHGPGHPNLVGKAMASKLMQLFVVR